MSARHDHVGYARVSTTSQDTTMQTDALHAAGCARIFTDTISSRTTIRPGLRPRGTLVQPLALSLGQVGLSLGLSQIGCR
ncbi:recombinase family protein [Plantibacter sp. RU18]|uniref:recombinase family protein n=1 Tax=Plantibacter sp. RU18 TaxID=3158143 RepID=UPI003D36694B